MPVSFETMRQQDRDTVRAHIRSAIMATTHLALPRGICRLIWLFLIRILPWTLCAFVSAIQNPARLLVSPIPDHR